MTNQEILNGYRALVPFLAELCGPNCEVLLHDVTNPKASVVAVANAELHSGRRVGSALTDYALEMIRSKVYEGRNYLSNYAGTSKGKNYVCSTFFIKNGQALIGMLCVNRDMAALVQAEKAIAVLKSQFNLLPPEQEVQEVLDEPVSSLLRNMIDKAIQETGTAPDRMKKAEKAAVVRRLSEQGALRMKGAVAQIAQQLEISEPSVYRYLREEEKANVSR